MEIVKTTESAELEGGLNQIQKEAYEQAQLELDKFKKDLETKKYLVDLKLEDIKKLEGYISKEAAWKFTEALGIREVVNELGVCVTKGKLFMSAISIEALYFYLSRIEGAGDTVNSKFIESVDTYLTILKNINIVRNVIAQENEKLKEMEFITASRREGIDPSNPEASL